MNNPLEEILGKDPHKKSEKRLREKSDSSALESLREDMKSLVSSSRKFFKKQDGPKKPLPVKLPKIKKPKATSAMGRSMGLVNQIARMSSDAILDGNVDHKKYEKLVKHDKKKKPTKSTPSTPSVPNEEKKRGRPVGTPNKEKTTKTESDKKHEETQTKKIEDKVETTSNKTNSTFRKEITRLIKSDKAIEKARNDREDRLRRKSIDWSPDKATTAKPKQSKAKAKAPEPVMASPQGGLPMGGRGFGIGGAMSKVAGGAKALGASAVSTLGTSVGTMSAGAVGAVGVGSAVAGLAIGNYLTESGMMGEDMAKGYSVGDFMSSWFGEGTRNVKRHIDIEKKKALAKADKTFKVMTPRAGPWQGVSKERMATLRRNPSKYGQLIEAYYRLYMRETEMMTIYNVMGSHEDAKNLGEQALKDSEDLWRLAMEDRIDFKKKHIIGPKATSAEKKLAEGRKKAVEGETKQLDSIGVKANSDATVSVPKSNVKVSNGGSSTGNANSGDVTVNTHSNSSTTSTTASLSKAKTSTNTNGLSTSKATVERKGRGATFTEVTGAQSKQNLDNLQDFLLNKFAPVLASHIISQGDEKRKENSRRSGNSRPTQSNNMGSPTIFM